MSNLVSVKRTDKNGKVVTRHIKQSGSGTESSKSVPSPHITVSSEKERRLNYLAEKLHDTENEIKIADLNAATQDRLLSMADSLVLDADATVIWRILNPKTYLESRNVHPSELPSVDDEIRQLSLFHQMDEGIALIETQSFTRGMYAYQNDGSSDEQNKAIIHVAIAAQRMLQEKDNSFRDPSYDEKEDYVTNEDLYLSCIGGDYDDNLMGQMWLRNDKLVDLISRRPNEAERIIDVINARKTVQPDTIEALLDFESHDSLSDGAL